MGHGADLGTELAADRALIELVAGRCEAECDPARRHALIKQLTVAVEEHLTLASASLTDAVRDYVPERDALSRRSERAREQVSSALGRLADSPGHGEKDADLELVHELAQRSRALLEVEQTRLLPVLEQAVTWPVLQDLGERVRAGRH